jgi:glycosyltransferase involved in cell wall biosynthesis
VRILHAYNRHRGGGGANNATQATIDLSREHGLEVEVYARSANDLSPGLRGRLQAGLAVVWGRESTREFVALLDSFRPEIVHIHELYPLISPWILPRCAERNIPVVMSCVDYRLTCPVVTHFRAQDGELCTRCLRGHEYQAVFRNCRGSLPESLLAAWYVSRARTLGLYRNYVTRYIAPSNFARSWFVQHAGIDPTHIVTVPPAVRIPAEPSEARAGKYVAFAGRFAPEKGLGVFAAAARDCGVPFRMARNSGSLITTDVPKGPEVVITHSAADLDAFFRAARLVVVPSLWYETFGLVAAEAMSYGIPVVGSRLGAICDLIDDGVDGLLFEPGNAVDLAEKVMRLWNDAELARSIGVAARRKAASTWNPTRHLEGVLQVYRDVWRMI